MLSDDSDEPFRTLGGGSPGNLMEDISDKNCSSLDEAALEEVVKETSKQQMMATQRLMFIPGSQYDYFSFAGNLPAFNSLYISWESSVQISYSLY